MAKASDDERRGDLAAAWDDLDFFEASHERPMAWVHPVGDDRGEGHRGRRARARYGAGRRPGDQARCTGQDGGQAHGIDNVEQIIISQME